MPAGAMTTADGTLPSEPMRCIILQIPTFSVSFLAKDFWSKDSPVERDSQLCQKPEGHKQAEFGLDSELSRESRKHDIFCC